MSAIPLTTAQQRLTEYLDAESKVLQGQSYAIAGRSLTRANLSEIREGIEFWSNKVATLQAAGSGRSRARTMVPGN